MTFVLWKKHQLILTMWAMALNNNKSPKQELHVHVAKYIIHSFITTIFKFHGSIRIYSSAKVCLQHNCQRPQSSPHDLARRVDELRNSKAELSPNMRLCGSFVERMLPVLGSFRAVTVSISIEVKMWCRKTKILS